MILCFFVCLFDLLCFSFFLSPCLPWADMLCLLATFAPFTFPISLQLAVNVPTICVPGVDRGYVYASCVTTAGTWLWPDDV